MKPLLIDSTMTSLGGIFYPTGQVFALFPDEDCVRQAAAALLAAGHQGDTAYASPDVILQEIVRTLGTSDAPMPSVGAEGAEGAEGDMVRRIADLASTGHHGMLIAMADEDDIAALVQAIAPEGAVTAFHYRTFIIEDLIAQPAQDGPQSVVVGTHVAQSQWDN